MRGGSLSEPCSCGSGCDCGCCEGTEPLTPQRIANRPGLDALAYRVGTHSSFLETMQARLSSAGLAGLTTREGSDPAIALLDTWAVVGDVLTFYQERIANEAYLRTATERRSVLELARLVGYAPRPGVASSVYLAYTLDPGPETVIPAGARVQSVPGPGEMPQPFETSEDLAARAAWNNLQVRLTRPQQPEKLTRAKEQPVALYFQGIATNLKPNDPLLIETFLNAAPALYRTLKVEPDAVKDRTRIEVEPWKAEEPRVLSAEEAVPAPRVSMERLRETLARFGDLETLGISPGATTRRVLSHLEPLKAALDAGAGETELRALTREALSKLREEHRSAVEKRASRLEPWIGELVAELERGAGLEERAPSAAASAVVTAGTLAKVTSLPKVLGSLGKRPQAQPRNSLRLERDAGTLLGPGSDVAAKLMTAARPELRDVFYKTLANVPVTPAPTLRVWALRVRASVFGHNASLELVPDEDLNHKATFKFQEWGQLKEEPEKVWLDAPYPQILAESWIVLLRPAVEDGVPEPMITRVLRAREQSRAEYGISAKATRLALADRWLDLQENDEHPFAVIRGTAVFAQPDELALAEEPIEEPLCGQEIELAGLYDGLSPGRWLIITGERTDVEGLNDDQEKVPVAGIPAAELVMLAGVKQGVARKKVSETAETETDLPGDRTHTTLTLAKPLAYCYKRDTVTVHGNVAHATHGETRYEVLGSGDGARALQSFKLKQPPLTYVSAPTPSGIESTLQVRVDDVLWHEADSLAGMKPTDRSYTLRTDDGGQTTVVFGNGERGARLPTGRENVRAAYRGGIGKGGNLKAGQISQLATRPLGVKDVINPLPATGGAGPESRDQARRNAPLAVMALDRLISVQDYADFARTFAGIGKASAARLTDGRVQLVHVTIAGEDGIPILEDSDLFQNLEAALRRFGDPRQPLRLEVREASFLFVEAEVRVLPDYQWEKVEPKIRAALLDTFGFTRRDLGQDALLSEVYGTVQGIRGVDFVDVDVFDTVAGSVDPEELKKQVEKLTKDQPRKRLPASPARNDKDRGIRPAQLIYLTPEVPDTLILKERK